MYNNNTINISQLQFKCFFSGGDVNNAGCIDEHVALQLDLCCLCNGVLGKTAKLCMSHCEENFAW